MLMPAFPHRLINSLVAVSNNPARYRSLYLVLVVNPIYTVLLIEEIREMQNKICGNSSTTKNFFIITALNLFNFRFQNHYKRFHIFKTIWD